MRAKLISTPLQEALDRACERNPVLEKVRAKTRAILEDYASLIGTSESKLRCSQVCDQYGNLTRKLEQHVLETYQLSDGSRLSYHSDLKRLAKAITADEPTLKEGGFLQTQEIPEQMLPMLEFLRYTKLNEKKQSGNQNKQIKEALNLTLNGQFFLEASLAVWNEFNLSSLESLFQERVSELNKAIRKLGREKYKNISSLISSTRNKLMIPPPQKVKRLIPIDEMLEPFRTEIKIFSTMASTLDSLPHESVERRALMERAIRFGLPLRKLRKYSSEGYITYLRILYGYMLPAIKEKGMTTFSVSDLLRITRIKVRNEEGKLEKKDINLLLETYRQSEKNRSDQFKRTGFDSRSFAGTVCAIKALAIFTGNFTNLEQFRTAYMKITLDKETMERRKELKKKIFSIEFIDEQIERLGAKFQRIVSSGSFKMEKGRCRSEVREDINLCLFYVILVYLRYSGYRQQCARNCILCRHIMFGKDRSIKFAWSAEEVKNYKSLLITYEPERNNGKWSIFVQTLLTYNYTIYPYILNHNKALGKLDLIDGQFFVKLNVSNYFECFGDLDGGPFNVWFSTQMFKFITFPDEAYELNIFLHPHHLRGLYMDWLYYKLGMSFEEISELTGISVNVIKSKYLDKKAARDGASIIRNTDKRLNDEALESTQRNGNSKAEEIRDKERIKELELQLKVERELRLKQEEKANNLAQMLERVS